MSTYLKALASYLPKLIVQRANDGRLGGNEPVAERFPAALLFADVSGFTSLTERLAAGGPAGTEHLTQILNLYFGRIIDIVEYWGGDVVKFAGDALIVLWPAPDGAGAPLALATRSATACALQLQRELNNYDVGGDLRLSMKISIGAGTVICSHLGGVYERWEFLLAGSPLEQVGIANGMASPGDVMLSAAAMVFIRGDVSAEALDEGAFRVTGALTAAAPAASVLDVLPVAAAALRRYIPGAIRTRLDANQTDWLGEQRRLSVIFLNLPTFSAERPLADAHQTMKSLQLALYRFEGSINKISVDDKGASLIAVLGLPPLGHVDDPERAVRAAIAMRQVLTAAGHECTIGITTGLAFCGSIGNEQRREYTVMGNIVNLAARLMQAAKAPGHGGLLCDEPTWNAAQRRLKFETLPPIKVKGRSAPVAIFRPIEGESMVQASTSASRAPAIGREAEIAILSERLDAIARGEAGGCVLVKAERGMGMGRTLEEAARRAGARGMTVLVGAGDSIDHHTPYAAWRSVFEALFRTELTAPDTTSRRYNILASLPDEPRLLKAAPLFEPVLPLGWEDNDETRNLAGSGRAERTRDLFSAVLGQSAAAKPVLVVLHDAQWIDGASGEMLMRLAGQAAPLLVIASFTPEAGRDATWLGDLEHKQSVQVIELKPLTDEAIAQVACWRLGVKTLPDLAARLIIERAEGVPVYAEEIALALRADGLLVIQGEDAEWRGGRDLKAIKLPNTVEG
ncbi:MAG: adenylate/guanylate cyclase domain-containing protein, partial [Betaproteobacteria bacterium]